MNKKMLLPVLLLPVLFCTAQQAVDSSKYTRLVNFTQQQDRANMLQQMGIQQLRPGPSGDEKAPNHANYDQSAASPCPQLPDQLVAKIGKKVTGSTMCFRQRRLEIIEDFEREMYGRIPKNVPKISRAVKITNRQFVGRTPAIAKLLLGHVDNNFYPLINAPKQVQRVI